MLKTGQGNLAGLFISATSKKGSASMATFHLQIKSGGKGTAGGHADYIARNGFHRRRDDLVHTSHGNLPHWAANDPKVMWRAADKYERKNGAAYREAIIALPTCRVPDEYLLHNGSSLLAGREVLLGVLNDLRAEEPA